MKFLVLFTHQTWPMHYFQAGVMARALVNDGHEVLWVNCERVMHGCHVHWIVPTVPADDICNACVTRGSWLDDLGLTHVNLGEFLTDDDRAEARRVAATPDVHTLHDWVDNGCPVGRLSLSAPQSATRTMSIDDPAPAFLGFYQKAVASAVLVNRALEKLFTTQKIDRILIHLGRLIPDSVAQHHAGKFNIPWFSYETGNLRNSLRLIREATVYSRPFYRNRWPTFAQSPLNVEQIATIQHWLRLRRMDRRKAGMLTYSPVPTTRRKMFEQVGIAPTRKLAAFFTSSMDEIAAIGPLTDPDWKAIYPDQYALVLEAVQWAKANPDWTLVVRIHPNEGARSNHLGMIGTKSLAGYQEIFAQAGLPQNVKIVPPDAPVSSYTLMEAAALGIVWASTASLEMATMGRPVIIADNPAFRTAGFGWLVPQAGALAATIDDALSSTNEERVQRAIIAQRYAYHQYARYSLPFPMIHDHGRMERISLAFGEPENLVRGRWPTLDRVLDYLTADRSPYETAPHPLPGDARNERASITRMLARDDEPDEAGPPPESVTSLAEFQAALPGRRLPAEDAEAVWDDLQRVLRVSGADAPLISFGPVAPLLRAIAPARTHLAVDHRRSEVIEAPLGGLPSHLPFRERCAGAVVLHGLPGDDPAAELRAARSWLRPGGVLLVLDVPGIGEAAARLTPAGLHRTLDALGFTMIVVRPAAEGGLYASGVLPGAPPTEATMLARRDVLSQVLPPVRREPDRITTLDGARVLLSRQGEAWSAWPEHVLPLQPLTAAERDDFGDLRSLVPQRARRVLEVGCRAGALGAALKAERPALVVEGIEATPHLALHADAVLDRVYVGAIDALLPRLVDNTYDCIVLADHLATLPDPAAVVRQLRPKLKADGTLVVSLPNARQWAVLQPLLEGKLDYVPGAPLTPEMLRLHTRQTMAELFHLNGFDVTQIRKVEGGETVPGPVIEATKGLGLDVSTLEDEGGVSRYLLLCQRRAEARERMTSIVLLAWNQLAYTKLCIESIFKHTHVPFELVLVDNGSHDGTPEYFRELRRNNANVKLVLNPKNLGFGKGSNQGLAAANGDYVCFLNNDTLLTDGWLERLQWWAELEPHVGIVGPVSNRVAGIQKISPVTYDEDSMAPEGIAAMETWAAQYQAAHRHESTFVNRIIGLCLLLKRELIERIGGFDTRFGTGNFEDDDLCFRARVAGYKVVIARDVFIHHYGSKSFEGNKVDYTATMERNMELFLRKWSFEKVDNGYKPTGLDAIVYDRAKHFAPYGAEEGFRSDAAPVELVDAREHNVLVVPPWGEDDALVSLLRTLAPITGDVCFLVRCPPYEGKSHLALLERIARQHGLDMKADLRLVDAPLAPDREAGLYLAASAVYVDENWADADIALRRAVDCGVKLLRGPADLAAYTA
jgi:GT2 family glycosyltransferase/SAM-dependent methyltransferase